MINLTGTQVSAIQSKVKENKWVWIIGIALVILIIWFIKRKN